MKKITVIIPAYNNEKYFLKTLKSIESQTIFNLLKIVIVDDCSVDKTYFYSIEFREKYKDSVIVLKNNVNKGVSFSRNEGLKLVDTKYFSFIDSDDVISEDYYEKMLFMSEVYESDISVLNYVLLKDSKILDINKNNKKLFVFDSYNSIFNFLSGRFLSNSVCNKLFLYEKFKGVKFDETLKIAEDMKFSYDCLKQSSKVVVDLRGQDYFYVQNSYSAVNSNLFSLKFLDVFKVIEYIENDSLIFKDILDFIKLKEQAYIIKRIIISSNRNDYIESYLNLKKELKISLKKFNFYKFIKFSDSNRINFTIFIAYLIPNLFNFINHINLRK